MRIVRFLCSDGRVLLGDDENDGTATVLVDADGLFGPCEWERAAREMLRGRRALVADDDEGIRMTVSRTLEKFECECTICTDGAQAIDLQVVVPCVIRSLVGYVSLKPIDQWDNLMRCGFIV